MRVRLGKGEFPTLDLGIRPLSSGEPAVCGQRCSDVTFLSPSASLVDYRLLSCTVPCLVGRRVGFIISWILDCDQIEKVVSTLRNHRAI